LVVPREGTINDHAKAQRELLFGEEEYLGIGKLASLHVVKVAIRS